jgi:hypothetical protein
MEDDITIGVTEIVNNIEVTAQPNDQIIDIDVIDNSDSVTLNVTPNIIEVNVERGSSFARWGTIYGSILDQTDLQNALFNKADLVNGLVPAYQLPSFVDDVIEVANFASLPTTGETGKLYLTLDNNKIYRWGGSTYVEIASNQAIWGQITGTLSNQTDLQNVLNLKADKTISITPNAPLTGGGDLSANRTISINQSGASSDGFLSSTDWNTFNNKQNQLNGTGFVKVSGTTISYDNNIYALDSVVVKLTGNQTIDGEKTFSNALAGTSAIFSSTVQASAFRLTGMTAGSGALYWSSDRVTLANYNTNGIVDIEALGGSSIATFGNFIDLKRTVFVNSNLWAQSLISRGNPSDSYDGSTYGATPTLVMSVPQTTSDKRSYAFQMNTSSGLDLWHSNAAGVSSRRLTVSSNGNVGIGTTSPKPYASLTNNGQFLSNGNIIADVNQSYCFNKYYNAATITDRAVSTGFVGDFFLDPSGVFQYRVSSSSVTQDANASLNTRFAITADGNVGLGTTSPFAPSSSWRTMEIKGSTTTTITGLFARNSDNSAWFGFYLNPSAGATIGTTSVHRLQFVTQDIERIGVETNGNVKINNLGTGSVFSNGGVLTNTNPSDERLKENIDDLEYGLTEILQLRPVSYNWINDSANQGKQFGFIAQEVQEIMPDLINEFTITDDKEEVVRLGLDKEAIFVAMVNAIKELKAEIDLLKQKA